MKMGNAKGKQAHLEKIKQLSQDKCIYCVESKQNKLNEHEVNTKLTHDILFQKYRASIDIYNVKVINEIIFNRPVKITSMFKDYLVHDEIAEFMKRYYAYDEIPSKVKRLSEYFNSYFKIFPNYIQISERSFMYKNIERKQRVIDERQIIAAKNEQLRKRKEQRHSKKLKISKATNDVLINIEGDMTGSGFDTFTKLFTQSYYKDITKFRNDFSGRKMSDPFESENQEKSKEITSIKPKVFNYLARNEKYKPVILSRNIIENVASKAPKPICTTKESGWTKLFNFFSDESHSFKHSKNNEISISISKATNKEKSLIDYEFDSRNFNVEHSQTSTQIRDEILRKNSKETQDLNNKSTNIASTLEATLGEKQKFKENKVMENITDSSKLKKFRILKNQKRFKPTLVEDSYRDLKIKNSENKQQEKIEQIELSCSNLDSSLYNMIQSSKKKLPPIDLKKNESISDKQNKSIRKLDSSFKNDTRSSVNHLEKYEVDVVIKVGSPNPKDSKRENCSPKRITRTTLGMASMTNTSSLSSLLKKRINQEGSLRSSFAPVDINAHLTDTFKRSQRRGKRSVSKIPSNYEDFKQNGERTTS